MRTTYELRLFEDKVQQSGFAEFGKSHGLARTLSVHEDSDIFGRILERQIFYERRGESLVSWWRAKREYTSDEWDRAKFVHVRVERTHYECVDKASTIYLEDGCAFCGVGRTQVSPLLMPYATFPDRKLFYTSFGDVIASREAVEGLRSIGARVDLRPVLEPGTNWEQLATTQNLMQDTSLGFCKWFQLMPPATVHISKLQKAGRTISGVKSTDLCPLAHQFENVLLEPLKLADKPKDFAWQTTFEYLGFPGGLFLPMRQHILRKEAVNMLPFAEKDVEIDLIF